MLEGVPKPKIGLLVDIELGPADEAGTGVGKRGLEPVVRLG